MRTSSFVTTIILLAVTATTTGAQVQFALSPYGGTTGWSENLGLENRFLMGGRASATFIPWIGVEGTYGFSLTETSQSAAATDMKHWGLDLIVNLVDVLPVSRVTPYLLGGWSQLIYDGSVANPVGDTPYVLRGWEYGGGVKVRAGESDRLRADVRLDARDVVTDLVQWFPDSDGSHHNLLLTLGLEISMGRARDADGDGVDDHRDVCPRTPPGARVDAKGCPVDSDGDGVFDGLDRCDGTPLGASVDRSGCPRDTDGDGVFDGIDRCADTRSGASVDAFGCPGDEDGDGVPDGIDACFNTPAGATVTAAGCPTDTDGDGVFDGLDRCPDTPAGRTVDATGCEVVVSETEAELLDTGVISLNDVRFRSGSATLDPSSFSVLDEVASVLVEWPLLEIEIGGHTDSSGSDALNRSLSEKRARAVLDYLRKRFPALTEMTFTVKGYGEEKPIATNETREGRARNRRVEFRVVNQEALRHEILRRKSESR